MNLNWTVISLLFDAVMIAGIIYFALNDIRWWSLIFHAVMVIVFIADMYETIRNRKKV